jgi:hypothetical protein
MDRRQVGNFLIAVGILVSLWGMFVYVFMPFPPPPCASPVNGLPPSNCGFRPRLAESLTYWAIGAALVVSGSILRLWMRQAATDY